MGEAHRPDAACEGAMSEEEEEVDMKHACVEDPIVGVERAQKDTSAGSPAIP